jgi:hypothetical protein
MPFAILWTFCSTNRRFKFDKRSQLFIRPHNEAPSVIAVRVRNKDGLPVGIDTGNTAPTQPLLLRL